MDGYGGYVQQAAPEEDTTPPRFVSGEAAQRVMQPSLPVWGGAQPSPPVPAVVDVPEMSVDLEPPPSVTKVATQLPASPKAAKHSRTAMEHVAVKAAGRLPAERGWRRWLYLCTRINLGLSPDEVYERDLHEKIRRVVTPPPNSVRGATIAVVSLKGGVGKTAVTVLLGSVMAMVRGEPVLAVDANPDAGNLITRARKQTSNTVAQLVASQERLTGKNAVREMTSQTDANLEVLAADDYVDGQPFQSEHWRVVDGVTAPFYSITLADCGGGLHTDATRAVLDTAWAVVIVTDTSKDAATKAAETFDWINTHTALASRVVFVVNHTKPGKPSADIDKIKELLANAASTAEGAHDGVVIELPYEPHIAVGEEIDVRLVSKHMRRRVTEGAAALSEWFDKPR